MEVESTTARVFYSPDQVAQQLDLHVRTVRNYVRQGKLRAVRIGKQYRIAADDLADFVRPRRDTERELETGRRHVEVSSIVSIEAVGREEAIRLTNTLMASVKGRELESSPLRVDTHYDPGLGRLKVIVTGDLPSTTRLLELVARLAEPRSR